jgi:C-terminal processing protease CtpA/Prc
MNSNERNELLNKVDALVLKHFFDPKFNGRNWPALLEKHRTSIISAADDLAFEAEVNALLAELGTSHTRFFNKNTPVPGRNWAMFCFASMTANSGHPPSRNSEWLLSCR